MIRKIIITGIVFAQAAVLFSWASCTHFADKFHFSAFDLSLRIMEAEHNDQQIPILFVRTMHNKVVGFVLDIFRDFTHFWEPHFLIQFIGFIGIFGLGCGFYFACVRRNKVLAVSIVILLLLQILEIFSLLSIHFLIKIGVFWLLYQAFSVYGISEYLRKKSKFRYTVIFLLVLLSIWWYAIFGHVVGIYCFV